MKIINKYTVHTFLISLIIFISSALLFTIQPMIAKAILPKLGGSPEIWNSCMMFYQFLLFFGYLYAHLISKLKLKKQIISHTILLLLSLLFLPIGITGNLLSEDFHSPILWMVTALLIGIGSPFFIISTTSPLLQKWFSYGNYKSKDNPYFLYAISNLGSFIGLLSYPFFIERVMTLQQQTLLWSTVYSVFVILLILGGFSTIKTAKKVHTKENKANDGIKIHITKKIKWFMLAFCPSSLMLGVTTYITTDINPVPLLWIIPLSLYLLSYIIVFSYYKTFTRKIITEVTILLTLITLSLFATNFFHEKIIFLHLASFFFIAIMCHGELAYTKPQTSKLTEFYLILSLGGLAGGIFNSIFAPILFNSLVEYPIVLALSMALIPGKFIKGSPPISILRDFTIPGTLFLIIGFSYLLLLGVGQLNMYLFYIILALVLGITYIFKDRPVRFGLILFAFTLSNILFFTTKGGLLEYGNKMLLAERNFYGTINVIKKLSLKNEEFNVLYHGTTLHGAQQIGNEGNLEPLTYYTKTSPIGEVFSAFDTYNKNWNIASVGIGTGSLACYKKFDQKWDFYEIDPNIVSLSKEKKLFTFLDSCAPDANIIIGDARIMVQKAKDKNYNMIILDAFTSDAIPIHLITKDAFELYFSKLKNNGLIAIHVSNRVLNLDPVIANIAEKNGYCILEKTERPVNSKIPYHTGSSWIVMTKECTSIQKLKETYGWTTLEKDDSVGYWSDDFYNIFEIIKFLR